AHCLGGASRRNVMLQTTPQRSGRYTRRRSPPLLSPMRKGPRGRGPVGRSSCDAAGAMHAFPHARLQDLAVAPRAGVLGAPGWHLAEGSEKGAYVNFAG